MASFSDRSRARLLTCDDRLVRLMLAVVKIYDITVMVGAREREAQNDAYSRGRSKLQWPMSNHNVIDADQADELGVEPRPMSLAVDVAPWVSGVGVPWPETLQRLGAGKAEAELACWAHFSYMAGVIGTIAGQLGIPIRWGADWDRDGLLLVDQRLDDGPHIEIAKGKP